MDRLGTAMAEMALARSFDLSELYQLSDDGCLCSGSTGTVSKACRRSDSLTVALKDVKCPPGAEEIREVTRREYEFMTTLSHPSIVRALAIHEAAANVVVCMEYCDGGSLDAHVKSHGALAPTAATSGALQVLQGLDYLHSRRVVHRDLKPANILLSACATSFKIADFNSAKQIGQRGVLGSAMLTDRGTARYSAPEINAGQMWNERVDVWSAGLSIYFMRLGQLPFDVESSEVRDALRRAQAPLMDLAPLGRLMSSLVQQCLESNPHNRPPAVELLAHPLFRDSSQWTSPETSGGAGLFSWPVSRLTACGPRAYTDDLLPGCGLVCKLFVASRRDSGRSKAEDPAFKRSPKRLHTAHLGDQRTMLWCRLAERRFSRKASKPKSMGSRCRSEGDVLAMLRPTAVSSDEADASDHADSNAEQRLVLGVDC
jgi:serine/threonine protein kinase